MIHTVFRVAARWYVPHQETPRWPGTLSATSSPPWLNGRKWKRIYIITIWRYTRVLLTLGSWHVTVWEMCEVRDKSSWSQELLQSATNTQWIPGQWFKVLYLNIIYNIIHILNPNVYVLCFHHIPPETASIHIRQNATIKQLEQTIHQHYNTSWSKNVNRFIFQSRGFWTKVVFAAAIQYSFKHFSDQLCGFHFLCWSCSRHQVFWQQRCQERSVPTRPMWQRRPTCIVETEIYK